MIGDHAHIIDVPGRANYVYVSLSDGEVVEAFNNRVSPVLDLPVFVGYDPKEPNLLQVLSVRSGYTRYGDSGVSMPNVPEHHETHEWFANPGGNDVVFMQLRQFMPLRPTPLSTGVALNIYRGVGYLNNQWMQFTGSTIDLGSFIPSTGVRYILVYEDTNGMPNVVGGTVRNLFTDLSLSDIPSPVPGTLPIAIARIYSDQTQIYETRDTLDLIDARFPMWHDHSQYAIGTSGLVSIYDDNVFKVSGSAISFDDDLEVSVTGSIAYVNRIDTEPWQSYTGSSTITGWSSLTITKIDYMKIGKLIFVNFVLAGTSNDTVATFTLPHTSVSGVDSFDQVIWTQNSGTFDWGLAQILPSDNVLTAYYTANVTAWIAGGLKRIAGQMWYESET